MPCRACQAERDSGRWTFPPSNSGWLSCGHTVEQVICHSRPCMYVRCRHHLGIEVGTRRYHGHLHGEIRVAFPDMDLQDLDETCLLDAVHREEELDAHQAGGLGFRGRVHTPEWVGRFTGVGGAAILYTEREALTKLAADARAAELAEAFEELSPVLAVPLRFMRDLCDDEPEPVAEPRRPVPVVAKANGAQGRLQPDDPVRCTYFNATISVRCCLLRQAARPTAKGTVTFPLHEYCASGECDEGRDYRQRCSFSPEVYWASKSKAGRAVYQRYREDLPLQRRLWRKWLASQLPYETPSIDQPPTGQVQERACYSLRPLDASDDPL